MPARPLVEYIWSLRIKVKVDSDGTVPVGTQRFRLEACAPKTELIRCHHRDGSYSFLLRPSQRGKRPVVMLRMGADRL